MVNLLKNNSSIGIYILEDEGGWVAANTPGEADLDNLTIADTYMYWGSILRFEYRGTANYEGESHVGHKTWSVGAGDKDHLTGEAETGVILFTAEDTETNAERSIKIWKLNNRIGDGQKYLVLQRASEVFRDFPNPDGSNKKYLPVIIRGVSTIENSESGKDVQLINIACEELGW